MKRRIILLAVTFLCLMLVFGLYRAIMGGSSTVKPRQHMVTPDVQVQADTQGASTQAAKVNVGPAVAGPGDELYIEYRDSKDNWLESVYSAKKWQGQEDGSTKLIRPMITMFQKNNQQIHVLADEGDVYFEEVGSRPRLRRGSLRGNVKIIYDQSREQVRADMSQRPDDLMTISLEDIAFRDDLLRLSTTNSVEVTSSQADMQGRGLTVTWNEQGRNRELRELRLEQGREVVFKNVPLDMVGMSSREPKATSSQSSLTAPDAAAEAIAAVTAMQATAGTHPTPVEDIVVVSPEPAEASRSADNEKPSSQQANQYEVVLTDENQNIRATSPGRELRNAREIVLTFDADSKAGEDSLSPAGKPARDAKKSRAKAETKPATTTVTMTWDGPLVMRPVGHTDKPIKDKLKMVARGDNMTLSDSLSLASSGTVSCNEFEFRSPEKVAVVRGRPGKNVIMEMAGGDRIELPRMEFGRIGSGSEADRTELATLDGPGRMTSYSGRSLGDMTLKSMAKSQTAATEQAASEPAEPDVITWQKVVKARFAQGQPADGEKGEARTYIRDAQFEGDVELTEGKTGNYVKCQQLDASFEIGQSGKPFIVSAIASGKVDARQDKATIAGDRMELSFVERPDPKDPNRYLPQPRHLLAKGSPATMEDMSDAAAPVKASADTIECTLSEKPAASVTAAQRLKYDMVVTLSSTGDQLAMACQGENKITGPEVHLDQVGKLASVKGPGNLQFLATEDLEGRRLTTPQLLTIEWDDSMDYRGAGDQTNSQPYANLLGNVTMQMGSEYLRGGEMLVTFVPMADDTQGTSIPPARVSTKRSKAEAGESATKPSTAQRIGVGLDDFSARKISKVYVKQNVELVSEHANEVGKIDQIMQVKAKDNIVYDFLAKTAEIIGPGSIVMMDYRPNDPVEEDDKGKGKGKDEAASSGGLGMTGQKMQRPSRTTMVWTRWMKWTQDATPGAAVKDVITMKGNVQIANRCGKEILLEKPDATVKTGKESHLYCDYLEARFAPPPDADKADPKPRTDSEPASKPANILEKGLSMGQLCRFIAAGGETGGTVDVKDGAMQILGRHVDITRSFDDPNTQEVEPSKTHVEVRGEPGKAAIYFEDSPGKVRKTEAEWIKCTLKDGKPVDVETPKISGSGTR